MAKLLENNRLTRYSSEFLKLYEKVCRHFMVRSFFDKKIIIFTMQIFYKMDNKKNGKKRQKFTNIFIH